MRAWDKAGRRPEEAREILDVRGASSGVSRSDRYLPQVPVLTAALPSP
jgi:hypothetical protein